MFATPLHTEWRNYKINIIDTPGLDDFIGEVLSSIRVADTIVTVLNGRHGVEIGTEIIWNYVDHFNKPTLFVVNQIDHICQLTGNCDHVGIGSDLDGAFGKEQSPKDLETIADLQKLAPLLTQKGYSAVDIEKIFHRNFISFLERVWG